MWLKIGILTVAVSSHLRHIVRIVLNYAYTRKGTHINHQNNNIQRATPSSLSLYAYILKGVNL